MCLCLFIYLFWCNIDYDYDFVYVLQNWDEQGLCFCELHQTPGSMEVSFDSFQHEMGLVPVPQDT